MHTRREGVAISRGVRGGGIVFPKGVRRVKRKNFGFLLLKGLGFVVLGNVLCTVMTCAVYVFGNNLITRALSISFGSIIFYSLIFSFGWKEGLREQSLVRYKRVSRGKKYRVLYAGAIMYVFAVIPSVVLLFNKLFFPERDILMVYQLLSGSAFPFVQAFIPPVSAEVAWEGTELLRINNMSAAFPVLMCVYYLLIPALAQLGFYTGFKNILTSDMMYK